MGSAAHDAMGVAYGSTWSRGGPAPCVLRPDTGVKPHLRLRLRPGTPHRPVGSWLQLLGDASVAGPPFEPTVDRVLLRHPGGVSVVHEHDAARTDGWSADERAVGLDRVFRVVGHTDRHFAADVVAALAELPVVEDVGPGRVTSAPLPLSQAHARAPSSWAVEAVGLPDAHLRTRGAPAVTVAVLDTGVDRTHPEYADRLEQGRDFVDILDGAAQFLGDTLGVDADPSDPDVGHGSHVCGIVGARGARMSTGVAPGCRLLPVRVLGAMRQGDRTIGAGLVDNISAGIKWAVDAGADVLCMSLGIRHAGGGLPHRDVVRYAARRGVTIVAAAGNDGTQTLYYPGALPGVIAVGAVGRDRQVADYSTWGDQVALVAPGTEIWSSWVEGGYAFATGTSQATPYVVGAAALCQSLAVHQGRRLTPTQLLDVLRSTADRPGRAWRDPHAGAGLLNVADALALTAHRLEAPPTTLRSDLRTSRPHRRAVPA